MTATSRFGLVFGLLIVGLLMPGTAAAQFGNNFLCAKTDPNDNRELRQLITADQTGRRGHGAARGTDADRLARVFALLHADSIRTAADFANASLILQHGQRPEHYLLAHEFTVIGVGLGCGESFGGFMLPATAYRLLYSLGLDPAILEDAAQSGFDVSSGIQIRTYPPATLELTSALLTQVVALRQQLRTLKQQHPDYPWSAFSADAPLDTLTAAVARTPTLAAAFAQAHLTPSQWRSFGSAMEAAIGNAFFAPIVPRPMAAVTGALQWPSLDARNISFVIAQRAKLEQLGYHVGLLRPAASELARAHLVSVVLPSEPRAAQTDPCPAAGPDTAADNSQLSHLAAEVTRANRLTSSKVAAGRSQVLALLRQHALQTPRDYLRAALIMERGNELEDALRVHNLALTAAPACGGNAMQMAAVGEDRFLALLGLQQRFGTLPSTLVPVDTGPAAITERVRRLVGLPPR